MRYWIDLVENKKASFFHFSSTELSEGTIVGARDNFSVHDDIEKLLEEARPPLMMPRNKVIYMMRSVDDMFYFGLTRKGFLYEIFPHGSVSKHDSSNIGSLQKARRSAERAQDGARVVTVPDWLDHEQCLRWASYYWDGVKNPDRAKPLWEFTASAGTIGKLIFTRTF